MIDCGCRKGAIRPGCARHDSGERRKPRHVRAAFLLHEILGRPTAWLAAGYREGTPLERACIWPAWAISRCLSTTAYVTAMWLVRDA